MELFEGDRSPGEGESDSMGPRVTRYDDRESDPVGSESPEKILQIMICAGHGSVLCRYTIGARLLTIVNTTFYMYDCHC